ncbi:ATP-binding cassette domain-containing protein [Actinotalea ferrariae]|uniref:ATP-binding cassette domain-containing protein n=1 Tax=Actinotalea ferrariae TaxID=1386098 RepID=UPI001C8BF682|nr:ATP-binding cassette domain-containing protein [Actinotalea ferrariae]MBX9244376.1 ATP-binding cassette domain-containing protein [Actinotalea ferrariae]
MAAPPTPPRAAPVGPTARDQTARDQTAGGGAEAAVLVRGLRKTFGGRTVLDGVDLAAPPGTVLALLGPNGAGKTTTVRIVSTLLRPDGGEVRVAGHDVVREPDAVRRRIGLVGQHAAVDEVLGARQNLVMFGRLHHLGKAEARRRADAMLERFGLTEAADRPVQTFSGGMRRRLDLAAGLLVSPDVLLLDEPTTGLDPQGRLDVWAAVRGLAGQGVTVVLTTQHLEEADRLADQVCVLDGGRVVASGTPDELKAAIGGDRIDVVVAEDRRGEAARVVAAATGTPVQQPEDRPGLVTAPVADRMAALTAVVRALDDAGLAVVDVGLRRPTLDEAYLRITGRPAEAAQQTEVAA